MHGLSLVKISRRLHGKRAGTYVPDDFRNPGPSLSVSNSTRGPSSRCGVKSGKPAIEVSRTGNILSEGALVEKNLSAEKPQPERKLTDFAEDQLWRLIYEIAGRRIVGETTAGSLEVAWP